MITIFRFLFIIILSFFSTSTVAYSSSTPIEEIFIRKNQDFLCTIDVDGNGIKDVDPYILAQELVGLSNVRPALLFHANREGDERPITPDTYVYAISSNAPFGTGEFSNTTRAANAVERLRATRGYFTGFIDTGAAPKQGFVVVSNLPQGPTSQNIM